MNIVFFLTPKANCVFLYDDFTIRQALEHMEQRRFASIPILKRTGEYVGTITEGDLLWAIKNQYMMNMKDAEKRPVLSVPRRKDYRPVHINTTPEELLTMAVDQNFVPMIDDRNTFIGLVTRQKIMQYCLDAYLRGEIISAGEGKPPVPDALDADMKIAPAHFSQAVSAHSKAAEEGNESWQA